MHMERDWNDPYIVALSDTLKTLEINSYLGTHEDNIFLVLEGWDEVEQINEYLKANYSHLDEDISIDFILPWNHGFSDEYTSCSGCGKIIRTSPDSYSWLPQYELCDAGIFCLDCIDFDSYIENMLNEPTRANTVYSDGDFLEHNFQRINADSFESGWYGRNDEPKVILKKVQEKYPTMDFVFSICSSGQFATQFDIWGRERA